MRFVERVDTQMKTPSNIEHISMSVRFPLLEAAYLKILWDARGGYVNGVRQIVKDAFALFELPSLMADEIRGDARNLNLAVPKDYVVHLLTLRGRQILKKELPDLDRPAAPAGFEPDTSPAAVATVARALRDELKSEELGTSVRLPVPEAGYVRSLGASVNLSLIQLVQDRRTFYGLPAPTQDDLRADAKRLGFSDRDYLIYLLTLRHNAIVRGDVPTKPAPAATPKRKR